MSSVRTLVTAEDLLRMPRDDFRYELIYGELRRMSPAVQRHGRIAAKLNMVLHQHVSRHDLGTVFATDTGFKLASAPDLVRAPDAAFVRQARIDEAGDPEGFWPGAPDLAAEVLSPSDTVLDVEQKVRDWLKAGTALVWVVSPELHTVTVYRSLTDITILTEKDNLDGGELMPGFRLGVAELFV
ncbi:MAG: Uma2 family endonuclease [Acidobacteria bacterium]|nr:Uma2 family endonuclease [Acidobacteriota bacterium]